MSAPKSTEPARPQDPEGPTGKLCDWINTISLEDVPEEHRTRAKYLILDGIACGLLGAHLPWSERAAHAVFDIEPTGACGVIGWDRKLGPLAAALLNSSFIQGFELDDWHSDAPLHSTSILLPTLFALADHLRASSNQPATTTGSDLLLAVLVGFEVGPRVGLALHGTHLLSMGWHSGAVFGPAAGAAAAAKLLRLAPDGIEDALGIACTQACGLMSAQFESDVKRMQHGFAARSALLGALLARGGYTGIKSVFEREYGGFLKQFSAGNGREPQYMPEEVYKGLGQVWKIEGVRVKPYASMAATHATIDCIMALQAQHPDQMKQLGNIKSITVEMAKAAFHHGGWKAKRPLTSTGAQMSASYVAATQIVDNEVLPAQFADAMLERDSLWALADKTECVHNKDFQPGEQRVTVVFEDGTTLSHQVEFPRGVNPVLSNEEIVSKWRILTKGVIPDDRRQRIEDLVLSLDSCKDVSELGSLLAEVTKSPIS